MALTTKAKRRLTLLLVLIVLISAGVAGLYYYQQQRRAQIAEHDRIEGLAAFEQDDYPAAIEHLRRYHGEVGGDGQTLYAYAQARLAVPTEDSSYLVEGMHALQRAVGRPGAPEQARHELLDLYNQLGNSNNALDLAEQLLADDEDDAIAWRGKAIALTRLNEPARALEAAERALAIEPGHWQTRMLTFQLHDALGESPGVLLDKAKALIEAHPDDPRYELLMGYAHSLARDREQTVRWLRQAADRDLPDTEFLRTLVRFLDGAELYGDARRVLATHVDRQSPAALYHEMAQRLFEGGHIEALADRLEHIDPTAADLDNAHASLAGLRALALYRIGQLEPAGEIVAALEAQANRPLAEAWASVLQAAHGTSGPRTGRVLQATEQALGTFPDHAVFRSIRAAAYEDVGEIDLALTDWDRAAELRPTWSVPRTRQARLLLRRGESQEAVRHAEAGLLRRPHSVEAAVTLAQARAAVLDPDDAEQVQALLALLDRISEHERGGRALPLYVAVLAQVGEPGQAAERIRQALEREPLPDRATLQAVAEVSRQHRLDVPDELANHLQRRQQPEVAGPEPTLRRALALAREGEVERGLALIERGLEAAEANGQDDSHPTGAAPRHDWLTARAEFLVQVGDPRGPEAWLELAERHPDHPTLQQQALRGGAAARDPAFAQRALDRLRRTLGAQSLIWRIERARWLLEGPEDQRDPTEAAELLEDVVSRTPDNMEPRLLLVQAHEQRGLRPLAIRELTAAAERRPGSTALALQLAQLHQSMHHFRSARQQLTRVVRSDQASIVHRRRAAAMLAAQGEDGLALEVLESLHEAGLTSGESLLDHDATLLLAELYRRAGRPQRVAEVLEPLLESPTPATLGFAATFHAARGDMQAAERLIARLDEIEASEADKALVAAEYLSRFGEPAEVVARYRQALAGEPQRIELWHRLIGFHMRRGETDAALAAADEAHGHASGSTPVLDALLEQRHTFETLGPNDRLSQMVGSLMRASEPAPDAVAEGVSMLGAAHAQSMSLAELAGRIENLAEAHPRLLVMQDLAIRLHLAADRPEPAAAIAQRAMSTFPRAAEPAALAAQAFSATGQWREARRAAEQWRRRAGPTATLPADLMIADADLALGQTRDALAAIEPYLDQARADPEAHAPVLMRYARSLIAANRVREAGNLLGPLLDRSAAWRVRWMQLASAAMPDRSTAENWLRQVTQHIDEADSDERARLARAWSELGTRFEASDLHAEALAVLDELVQLDDADASRWLQHGIAADQAGELEAAERSYRRALELAPELSVAHNNLAMVLLTQEPASPTEAIEHAQRAVQSSADNPYFLDTLAQAQVAAGDCEQAVETMQAVVRLQPEEPRWREHLANVLEACGQGERITELLDELDATGG